MFIRVYMGLLASVLVAGLASYGIFQWQYTARYEQYVKQVFAGSMWLTVKGASRHEGEKRQRWLALAEKLLGSSLKVVEIEGIQKDGYRYEYLGAQNAKVGYVWQGLALEAQVDRVSEQHLRYLASMLINELGRQANWQSALSALEVEIFPNLKLVDLSSVPLDEQQLSRLRRFDTVVSQVGVQEAWVYSRLPGSELVLVIGPIAEFDVIPLSLAIGLLLFSAIFIGGAAYMLIHRLERRVGTIERGVSEFAFDPSLLSLRDSHGDAIGRLASSVNGMSQRIHQLISDQKQMLQAISHELRTPISRMKFRLEMLADNPQQDVVAGLKRDIQDIDVLVTEAVSFNQDGQSLMTSDFCLRSLITTVIEDLTLDHSECDFELLAAENEYRVKQDKTQTKRALHNLIQNACKYGLGQVQVTLAYQMVKGGQCVCVSIEDNGNGIPDSQKRSVFSPFTRLETSRNRQTGGMGLGLAIVKHICDLCGYGVMLKDSELGGARFDIRIPVRQGSV